MMTEQSPERRQVLATGEWITWDSVKFRIVVKNTKSVIGECVGEEREAAVLEKICGEWR